MAAEIPVSSAIILPGHGASMRPRRMAAEIGGKGVAHAVEKALQ